MSIKDFPSIVLGLSLEREIGLWGFSGYLFAGVPHYYVVVAGEGLKSVWHF